MYVCFHNFSSTEPLTELIDTPVFYNLAPRPIKYRVSVYPSLARGVAGNLKVCIGVCVCVCVCVHCKPG